MYELEATCVKCGTVCQLPDQRIPLGRSYILCPGCNSRINIFKGVRTGGVLINLTGLRFSGCSDELMERFCEPGELWRVINVLQPCPDKGKGKPCELENMGRCPNQRLVVRLRSEKSLYKTCLYRKGRRIFDKSDDSPVGRVLISYGPAVRDT